MHLFRYIQVLLILTLLLPGCVTPGTLAVEILSPAGPHTIPLGETLEIQVRAQADQPLDRIEFSVDGVSSGTARVPGDVTSHTAVQTWQPTETGTYQLQAVAYNARGQSSPAASLVIIVAPPVQSATAPIPTPSPAPSTPTPTPRDCTYDAAFVADLTIPDDTPIAAGSEFVKTWRLRNSGTCDWEPGVQFVFVAGERMQSAATVDVPPTPAGSTLDLSVYFTAPQTPGTYESRWRMRAPDGQDFGVQPFVRIVVPPPATATPARRPTGTPGPRPDLDITLVAGDLEPSVGEPLMLRVTVHNDSLEASDQPVLVRAVLRAGLELEGYVEPVPPGGQKSVLLQHVFEAPADLEVFISVDPEDAIRETDEENNWERLPIVVNPPPYAARSVAVGPGQQLDLDLPGEPNPARSDVAWRVADGRLYLVPLNGAGVTRISGDAANVTYTLVAGSAWETEGLDLTGLQEGWLFGLRTSEGRVGYARVARILDEAQTRAELVYLIWDWH